MHNIFKFFTLSILLSSAYNSSAQEILAILPQPEPLSSNTTIYDQLDKAINEADVKKVQDLLLLHPEACYTRKSSVLKHIDELIIESDKQAQKWFGPASSKLKAVLGGLSGAYALYCFKKWHAPQEVLDISLDITTDINAETITVSENEAEKTALDEDSKSNNDTPPVVLIVNETPEESNLINSTKNFLLHHKLLHGTVASLVSVRSLYHAATNKETKDRITKLRAIKTIVQDYSLDFFAEIK